jgi:hypothetical protein
VVCDVAFGVALRLVCNNADVSGDVDFGDDSGLREHGGAGDEEEEDGGED